ncbi:hypothetical protein NV379_22485 [Paenibacillus sp. N1-5-1-14]|nr:hypothetical protein [Paenibacillus radicibacter]
MKIYGEQSSKTWKQSFILWRELIPAYLGPTIMAGIGGFITADKVLQIRALTTIGGSSLLIALFMGLWLLSRRPRKQWFVRAPRLLVTLAFTISGALFGLLTAWGLETLLPFFLPNNHYLWLSKVQFDFPLSSAIACATMSWRWRGTLSK